MSAMVSNMMKEQNEELAEIKTQIVKDITSAVKYKYM